LAARKAIMLIRSATPENFDELRRQVEETLNQELPKCGSLADGIREDALQQIEAARAHVQAVKEQREKDEARRQEEERLRKEQLDASRRMLGELSGLVEKAEVCDGRLREALTPVFDGVVMGDEEAKRVEREVAAAAGDARTACNACVDFVLTNRSTLESTSPLMQSAPTEDLRKLIAEAKEDLVKLQQRTKGCLSRAMVGVLSAKAATDKAVKKARAFRRFEKRGALFRKYDADNDGALNGKEVTQYAKVEFGFSVSSDGLARIMSQVAHGSGGVPEAQFQALKLAVGIAREEEAAKERKRQAEAKRKLLEDKKAAITADAGKALDAMDDVDGELKKAEEEAKTLGAKELEGKSSTDIAKLIAHVKELVDSAGKELAAVRQQITDLSTDIDPELATFVKLEARKLEVKVEHFAPRMTQASLAVEAANELFKKQERAELEELRDKVTKLLRARMAEKHLSQDELLLSMDKDGDGAVNTGDFAHFLQECGGTGAESVKLEHLFSSLDVDEKGIIPKESLLRFVRTYYRVVQETVVSTERAIKESKTMRRLQADEVVEVLEGPLKDESVDISRIKGCAMADRATGWITVTGNAGSVFLQECTPIYKVAKETRLTASAEATSDSLRLLREGERLEVLEWDRKDESSGVSRLRVKAKSDGTTGWVTKANSEGVPFLSLA